MAKKILLLIAAVLMLSAVIYFSPKKNATPPSVEAPDSASASDWKTYTNEAFGFEIKYPANYAVEERGEDGIYFYNKDTKLAPDSDESPPSVTISFKPSSSDDWESLFRGYFSSIDGEIKVAPGQSVLKNVPGTDKILFIVPQAFLTPTGYAFRTSNYNVLIYTTVPQIEEALSVLDEMVWSLKITGQN